MNVVEFDVDGCCNQKRGIELLCHQWALRDTIRTAIYTVTMDL